MPPLLKVDNLRMHFPVTGGVFNSRIGSLKAVDGVSFNIEEGKTLGLVGESGCGKSTLGKCVVRLLDPTSGSIEFEGRDITRTAQWRLKSLRSRLQMIFQDPSSSLNPRLTVGDIIEEPFIIQGMGTPTRRREWVRELLDKVGLSASAAERFSFEFSGGQRQRIGIARAIALRPRLIVCDEPVSALDVSVQSQVLNLLMELQKEMGLSYLFIAHDLAVVKHISDRIAVMYLGKVVEIGDADALYGNPQHAYTKALMSAIPEIDPALRHDRIVVHGDVPSPIAPPPGCAFGHRTQCSNYAKTVDMDLKLMQVGADHWVMNCPCSCRQNGCECPPDVV